MDENDGGQLPPDPMSAIAEGATSMHEIYKGYVEAGFDAGQALYLCGQILRASLGGPSSD